MIKNVTVEKLVYNGYGLGFSNTTPVFIPFSAPGDILDVEITSNKKKVIFAEISKIIKSSGSRTTPNCEVFGKCGGCNWLHIQYEKQLEFKRNIIIEQFRDIKTDGVDDIGYSESNTFYRNKGFYPISLHSEKPILGIYEKSTHKVIEHEKCLIQSEIFDQISKVVQEYLIASKIKIYDESNGKGNVRHLGIRYSKTTGEIIVILVTKNRKIPFSKQLVRNLTENFKNIVGIIHNINPRNTNVILGNDEKMLFGRDHIFEKLNGKKFKVNYNSFFQVNTRVAEKLYDFVLENINENSYVLDAFCGVGSIGISIATKVKKVIGIENNPVAVQNAEYNAKLNKLNNCEFICGDVENEMKNKEIDTIIFDPPRKGLANSILYRIPKSVNSIIYIACNPATQVRDVKKLIEIGFSVERIKPFDMFPHTYHIENVVVLKRK